ncbi:hypothetical protein J31TS4_44820 [Paenibacillus sp. J31TS4]|uniref:Flp pilus assembly protein CpaB n=1 Tax=Paenibacillus sp. J31TS4 TaxID=2807195 RepID=UPI001B1BD389|nr:SAF domain-containing protein [Paenibacillus sp. J31TS4]GIP41202.1 hypothetical protein J31TS4_44820 [Paenibacillus sp. J31TS4]
MLESKRKASIFLIVSLLFAATAGYLFFRQVQTLNNQLGGMTKVYVAAKDIPSRTVIRPDDVKTIDIPNKFVNPSHVTDPAQLQGRVFVVPLREGDLITDSILKQATNVQNENNRLVAVYASQKIRFDQELEVNDRVDLIVSQNVDGKPQTTVFMKDVLVSNVLRSGNALAAIGVEISEKDAPKLIHVENYADQIRVLKANVGKNDRPAQPAGSPSPSPSPSATPTPTPPADAAQPPAG